MHKNYIFKIFKIVAYLLLLLVIIQQNVFDRLTVPDMFFSMQ